MRGRVEQQLIESEVELMAEFKSNLGEGANVASGCCYAVCTSSENNAANVTPNASASLPSTAFAMVHLVQQCNQSSPEVARSFRRAESQYQI